MATVSVNGAGVQCHACIWFFLLSKLRNFNLHITSSSFGVGLGLTDSIQHAIDEL